MQNVEVTQLKMARGTAKQKPKPRLNVTLTGKLMENLDNLVKKGLFESRSDAVREALEDFVQRKTT